MKAGSSPVAATTTAAIPGRVSTVPPCRPFYKVDRLTRSLADFAKLIELLDAHNVSFISITQSFNTTTSMGRLTLNMLLSFAQFEREVTGERIRDKIAASKKKGLWVGGVVPLGYKVVDRKLMIDEAEAPIVRLIFERYCVLGSLIALMRELRDREVVTRLRALSSGKTIGGIAFTKGPLAYLLKNRMYLGEINHGQSSYPGEHLPIVNKASSIKCRRSSPTTPRPRAIPNPDRRPCSSENSTTTAVIA
jgi:site-specific DNA recombinase